MADLILIEQLRAYLLDQNVVRAHGEPDADTIPSIHLDPRGGPPEPAAGEIATVTLIQTNLLTPDRLEAWIEEAFVDVVVRSRKRAQGELIHRTIRGLLVDRSEWMMNDLRVEYSTLWRGVQPQGADETSYRTVQSFRFAVRVKSLAGLPYAP